MAERILFEFESLIGACIAAVLGFCIGLERKHRSKEAGIRTHTIVCFAAALFMIISDVGNLDTSRVAAQIIAGIGFIGAGMIVCRQHEVRGLTTAAGVWATAGVGMAAGAKMYVVAVVAAIALISLQFLFHAHWKMFRPKRRYALSVNFYDTNDEHAKVKTIFGVEHFRGFHVYKDDNGRTFCEATISTEHEISSGVLTKILNENPFFISIRRVDED